MAQQQQYIDIVEDTDVVAWQFTHPETGITYASEFSLRIVPTTKQRELRKKHTKFEFVRGSKQEVFDWASFNDDCLDYAIVDWKGVRRLGVDQPCERAHKLRLPEMVKTEITRLCLGKELGQEAGGEDGAAIIEGAEAAEGEQSPRPTVVGPTPIR